MVEAKNDRFAKQGRGHQNTELFCLGRRYKSPEMRQRQDFTAGNMLELMADVVTGEEEVIDGTSTGTQVMSKEIAVIRLRRRSNSMSV